MCFAVVASLGFLLLRIVHLAKAEWETEEEKQYVKALQPFPEAEFGDIMKKNKDGKEVKAHYYGFGAQSHIDFYSHKKWGNVCVKAFKSVADGRREVEVLKYLTAKRVQGVPRYFAVFQKRDFIYGNQVVLVSSFEGPWHMQRLTYQEPSDEDKELIENFPIRQATRQLLKIVTDLHFVGILHRDIKLDNVVIKENYDIGLVDFGLATYLQWGQAASGVRGTMYFTAPEAILGEGQSFPADVWSVGCVMLGAYERQMDGPFSYGATPPRGLYGEEAADYATERVLRNIGQAFQYGLRVSNRVPPGAYDLARNYLLTNVRYRSTAAVAHGHPWLWETPPPTAAVAPTRRRNSQRH